MLKVSNLHVPLDAGLPQGKILVERALRERLGLEGGASFGYALLRRSVDARHGKNAHFVMTCAVKAGEREGTILEKGVLGVSSYVAPTPRKTSQVKPPALRPVVVGSGPAGLFAALELAKAGAEPLVLERGYDVKRRVRAIDKFREGGKLDLRCNVQFGEGGAGTFSDGKLSTGTHGGFVREVLETFVKCGASKDILIDSKPHIGSDLLCGIVQGLRDRIEGYGGSFEFGAQLVGIELEGGRVRGAVVQDETGSTRSIPCEHVVLACGHSARDTYRMLQGIGVQMEPKPFSMGVRIEHSQAAINKVRYGADAAHPALGPADYHLSCRTEAGRGVYTFCMCPGGEVVCAASEEGGLATNGMSLHDRGGQRANSALLVGVEPKDFGAYPGCDSLLGMEFQRRWEQAAYSLGGGCWQAPAQLVGDFLVGRATSDEAGKRNTITPSYAQGVRWCDLRGCLPGFVADALAEALPLLDRKLAGFADPHAVMTAIESRSSAPVTLVRGSDRQSNIAGLYPCGEGSGHSGGIVSSAADGLKSAIALCERLR